MDITCKEDLLNKLHQKIKQEYQDNDSNNFIYYVDNLLHNIAEDDLQLKTVTEFYTALKQNWQFVINKNKSTVNIYEATAVQLSGHALVVLEIFTINKPFLMDSIQIALKNLNLEINFIVNTSNLLIDFDDSHKIKSLSSVDEHAYISIYIEIKTKQPNDVIDVLQSNIESTLSLVDKVVTDWPLMLNKLAMLRETIDPTGFVGVLEFIDWLKNNHFSFFGAAEFTYQQDDNLKQLKLSYVPNSGLGLLDPKYASTYLHSEPLNQLASQTYLNDDVIIQAKLNQRSPLHRSSFLDVVSFKIKGNSNKKSKKNSDKSNDKDWVTEIRFLGLYTAVAYNQSTLQIPYVRHKVQQMFQHLQCGLNTHEGKKLLNIVDNLPRDDVLQTDVMQLAQIVNDIFKIRERRKLKLFCRSDVLGKSFSCLLYIPRDNYDSKLRRSLQKIVKNYLQANKIIFNVFFAESLLVRVHFVVFVDDVMNVTVNLKELEATLQNAAILWSDQLASLLVNLQNSTALEEKYCNAFPVSYMDYYPAETALQDLLLLEELNNNVNNIDSTNTILINIYQVGSDNPEIFRIKLYRCTESLLLSHIVPIFENFGLQVLNERPFNIKTSSNTCDYWISEYKLKPYNIQSLDLTNLQALLAAALNDTIMNTNVNDPFNQLVLLAGLPVRHVAILRAYSKYLWQAALPYSKEYLEEALTKNYLITKKLIELFTARFDVHQALELTTRKSMLQQLQEEIKVLLKEVTNLSYDKILRAYLDVIMATVRTNFYQDKAYISFKIDSAKVLSLPKPIPYFEIFVYAIDCEGIHLRGDAIARGGVRWSDRIDDYRTEVLGLMKAQQVKNAVIVPAGAKGGFVVKTKLQELTKAAQKEVVVGCYKTFIKGLLDVTDNKLGATICHPDNCIIWDSVDPYLVVAADKGTAAFSDIANAIAKDYNFWLGDAFASGGSKGYDHKKMAITASGAFESVKLHFKAMGIDVLTQSVTVIGIGDMAGDVFGNGLLLSKHYKLVAAFNHMHIFIDPNPDADVSYAERQRLFILPTSSWEDYDVKKISSGGGIFKRSAKTIQLSDEIKKLLELTVDVIEPNELIKAILMAKVDLFWNGGIGTFVKAKTETMHQVGDRANDLIRIDGNELRCKVVAEGGNLGFTQLGRVEYALTGGILNTDALDNSAGVNSSDLEVNIKILFQELMLNHVVTLEQRDDLLTQMTSDVARLVLANNIAQNEIITMAHYNSEKNVKMHYKLLVDLEKHAGLDRVVEYLPSYETLMERLQEQQGFTRSELCVLIAYTKMYIKSIVLTANLLTDKYCNQFLLQYFPAILQQNYEQYILTHSLKREIIANQISNKLVNEMGLNFFSRIVDETGADKEKIIRAWLIATAVFNADMMRGYINNAAKNQANHDLKIKLTTDLNRLIRRATRWLLRSNIDNLDIQANIVKLHEKVNIIWHELPNIINAKRHEELMLQVNDLKQNSFSEQESYLIAGMDYMFAALDIVAAHLSHNIDLLLTGKAYFNIGTILKLNYLREMIFTQEVKNNWDALARASFSDDLDQQQIKLTILFLTNIAKDNFVEANIAKWYKTNNLLFKRWRNMLEELKAAKLEFTMFAVALRELENLINLVIT